MRFDLIPAWRVERSENRFDLSGRRPLASDLRLAASAPSAPEQAQPFDSFATRASTARRFSSIERSV